MHYYCENNHAAALLIPSRHIVPTCPFFPHLPHLNGRFGRLTSSCPPSILRFGGLPGGQRVEGGRTESSSASESSSYETTVGGECMVSPLTFVRIKIERDNRLLICFLVCCNGEDRFDITLWIQFLTEQNRDSMATWITRRLPDCTSAGPFCKVDNVIAMSFHRFDFVEDTGNRRHGTARACSIVGDALKVFGRLGN